MKNIFMLLMVAMLAACEQPLRVTGTPDPHSSTSGTLGSVRASNYLPPATFDSPGKVNVDTLNRRKSQK